jgi:cyclopropane-fatty-acyl-phospholipid synthase
MDLLCRKAELAEDKTVLDIGCGWGGFLSFAASQYKSTGIGLSISPVQVAYARKRYQGLPIEFRLQDYRDFFGKVDSVVSICMIEHVGPAHYREYFQKAYSSLSSTSGVFAMQCIIARDKRATMDPWTEKHIFPNGVLPTLRDLEKGVEGLFHIIDQEFFRDDYVKTFAAWRANLTRHRKEIVELYGEHYYRKYDYYLALYVAGFGTGRIDVGQFVLTPVQRLQYVPIRL